MSDKKPEIEALLTDFWEKNAVSVPPEEEGGIDEMLAPLDSQTAVFVLLDLEPLVGKKLPIATTVKKGGYKTKDEFVSELTAAVLEQMGKKEP